MKQVDYLILGQGISGTFLSFFLFQEGQTFHVIDEYRPNTASRVSSGVINPVTGRRVVKTWMADDIIPFAKKAYNKIGYFLRLENLAQEISIIDFVPTPQMLEAFHKRITDEKEESMTFHQNKELLRTRFNFPFEVVEIKSSLNINIWELLTAWRDYLKKFDLISEKKFDWNDCLVATNHVEYNGISAKKILCCEGVEGMNNPYFKSLPFAFNKGEALIVSIPGLSKEHIYKMSYTIVPLAEKDLFWVGSDYERNYIDEKPSAMFRAMVENYLQHWLKLPFTVVEHIASIRPANLERRPFVGLHPVFPSVGILNGLGTKGASLGPFFAYQLAHHLVYNREIELLADVKRFEKTLTIRK
ncbi:MAG: FAD-binding oxidoreductase [Sphingobacteriales bacterium]|jgi:glycine/D-amino acid oxidase-like deaminating enzyme|nr:FAD-binding oxidoreductase [Sphingobacteriales bacterium]